VIFLMSSIIIARKGSEFSTRGRSIFEARVHVA